MNDKVKPKHVTYSAFYISQRIVESRAIRFARYFRENRIDMLLVSKIPDGIDTVIELLTPLTVNPYLKQVSIERPRKIELFLPYSTDLLPVYLYFSKIDHALCLLYAAMNVGSVKKGDVQNWRKNLIVSPLDRYLKEITLPKISK
ncbi:hypothetical protein OAS86_02160 [Gammaproteobacteria bacterium]|nr:hypothetical protein [Gammaproteobacteria bacterium]